MEHASSDMAGALELLRIHAFSPAIGQLEHQRLRLLAQVVAVARGVHVVAEQLQAARQGHDGRLDLASQRPVGADGHRVVALRLLHANAQFLDHGEVRGIAIPLRVQAVVPSLASAIQSHACSPLRAF
ncbi:hypothetical protein D3C76_1205110 [compost metagenome]